MSKIHLLFEYKQEKNKYLIIFINQITDYAYRSVAFLNVCLQIRDMFYMNESDIKIDDLCDKLKDMIMEIVSEKLISITYVVYVAMRKLIAYRHRFPHGRINDFICEKALFIEVDEDKIVDSDILIDIAAVLLPIVFRFKRDDKSADGILMSNEPSMFYDEALLSSDKYEKLLSEQKDALAICENKYDTKILNVFSIF